MPNRYQITVLPGDGIGVEVMQSALRVIHALGEKISRTFITPTYSAGAVHYLNTAEVLPENVHYACRNSHAILFGAMGLPDLRGTDGTEIVPQLDLRFALDLYAGVRPIRPWARLPSPLASPRASEIELVLVRENTEGLFYARGRGEVTPDAALDTMRISRKGTARICDFAFALAGRRRARGGRGHVTNVDKASVFRSRD